MKRREFVALLGESSLSLSRPLAASAQRKVPLIGILMTSGPELLGPYREALRELGYIEGRTVEFESAKARGQIDRLPAWPRNSSAPRSILSWPHRLRPLSRQKTRHAASRSSWEQQETRSRQDWSRIWRARRTT